MLFLYLLMGRHRCSYCEVLHSSPVRSLAPTIALVQLGLDRDAPLPGENGVTEETREPQD